MVTLYYKDKTESECYQTYLTLPTIFTSKFLRPTSKNIIELDKSGSAGVEREVLPVRLDLSPKDLFLTINNQNQDTSQITIQGFLKIDKYGIPMGHVTA